MSAPDDLPPDRPLFGWAGTLLVLAALAGPIGLKWLDRSLEIYPALIFPSFAMLAERTEGQTTKERVRLRRGATVMAPGEALGIDAKWALPIVWFRFGRADRYYGVRKLGFGATIPGGTQDAVAAEEVRTWLRRSLDDGEAQPSAYAIVTERITWDWTLGREVARTVTSTEPVLP